MGKTKVDINLITSIDIDFEDIIKSHGEQAAVKVRAGAPKRTGTYAASIKSKYDPKKKEAVIGATDGHYRLTHLNEFGHRKRGKGRGRIRPHPHFRTAFAQQAPKFVADMKKSKITVKTKKGV